MIIYLAVFQAANIVGGYTGEHFYIKGVHAPIRFPLSDTADECLASVREFIKPKPESEQAMKWNDVSLSPPTLSALLLNAVLSGERVGQILYFITDINGKAIESGSYLAGDYRTGAIQPL